MTMTRYFVCPAPGYYGDRVRVLSSHRTIEAARRAAIGGTHIHYVVRAGHLKKGDWFNSPWDHFYPIVTE